MTRYWNRSRRERGATMVEFAFVFPIFIALILMIIELGIMFQRRTLIDDAVQAAGRAGASLGNDIDTDLSMLNIIASNAAQIGNNGVGVLKFVEIYEVDSAGNPTGNLNLYEYDYDPFGCDWDPCPQGTSPVNYNGWVWPPADRNVEVGSLDVVGVKAYFAHSWLTGVFPGGDKVCNKGTRTTTCFVEETTMRLEPLQFSVGG